MLTVKTKIDKSPISGIGLFADEFIPKNTIIWKFEPGFDTRFSEEDLERLSKPALKQFMNYCYHDKHSKKYILCFDDARFFNHSDNPNTINIEKEGFEEGLTLALRDIQPGEELTHNYYEYELDPVKEKDLISA